ncbi:MAG: hypothetical protein M1816_003730 [Peltula sp. TS41687]|nr:MAG: hypothetical protein M1816_003730 [Peltula sp. TS41687]
MRFHSFLSIIMMLGASFAAASPAIERRQTAPQGPPPPGIAQLIEEFKSWSVCMTDCIVSLVQPGIKPGDPTGYAYWAQHFGDIYQRCVRPPGPCGPPPNGGIYAQWTLDQTGVKIRQVSGYVMTHYGAAIQRGFKEHGPQYGVMLFFALVVMVVLKVPPNWVLPFFLAVA